MKAIARFAAFAPLLAACAAAPAPATETIILDVPPDSGWAHAKKKPTPAAARAPGPARAPGVRCDPAGSSIDVESGGASERFAFGRESVPGVRGADTAFGEMVLHEDGKQVFSAMGLVAPNGGGSVSLRVLSADPASWPGVGKTAIGLTRPGRGAERDELVANDATFHVTRFGGVGEWIEGWVAPTTVKSLSGMSEVVSIRFKLCRTADWRVTK